MGIPFVDLKAQYKVSENLIKSRINDVLDHGKFIMGPEVAELEKTLADYVGVKHAIGCSSGTDALLLGLMALNVGPGDAVFTTPFTFIATAEVISLLGATPVFVDIDPATYNIDPAELEKAVQAIAKNDSSIYPIPTTPKGLTPKGVIAVDLYGLPADYDALDAVCKKHNLFMIEDGAQSFGGEYKGKKACSLGDIGATSFFPAKPYGCYGDGGMVFTDREDLASAMRSVRIHGKGTDKYDNVRIGLNARLDTLQAAILLGKWEAFKNEVEERQKVAQLYNELLSGNDKIKLPLVPEGYKSGWAQYTLRFDRNVRPEVQAKLKEAGIPAVVYYPKPLHLQTAYQHLGYSIDSLPESEKASFEVLSLPFGPYAKEEDVKKVAAEITAALKN